ncbi:cuticular protein 66D isoform X2 [Anticarsia gemmatalis]|uniref:cuticular protein 66D isoform X2 n=1 Tax=Anticarsia gemmatalis TaxID=129554 RepID=UPI003F77348F
MLRNCVTLAVLGCVLAVPAPQHQYQPQQQAAGIPPHLLRQYLADQHGAAPAQTQVIPRTQHVQAPRPAPQQLFSVQSEPQYQPQQYQPQQQYRQQYQPQRAQEQREPEDYDQYRQQYQAQRPAAQPAQPEPKEEYDPHPSYQFGFDVNDDQYTNYQNRKEQRDGDVIKGSYSVVDSDGFVRTVTYTADPKEGFKAEVSRQPTDIVVKIPTPKPQLQLQPQPVAHAGHAAHAAHAQHAQPRPQPQQIPQQYYRYEQ